MLNSADCTKKSKVTLKLSRRTHRHEVDENLRAETADFKSQAQEFEWVACAGGIAHVVVYESAGAEDSGGGRSFGVDREIGEQDALRSGENALKQMKARQCDRGIAQAAEAIDENA